MSSASKLEPRYVTVWRMRRQGLTWHQIVQRLGITHCNAY